MAKGSSSYMHFNQLISEIKTGQLAPVYLLHGEEYFFLEKLLEVIEKEVLEESTRSFNHHVFYGKETNILDVISVAKRFPMMAEKQLVLVKEAQHINKADLIGTYLEQPLNSTVLVWYHPGKKLAGNRKPGTAFKKHQEFLANPLKEKEVPPVIEAYLKEMGYDIEPKSLYLLIEYSGARLSVIMKELDKVFANVPAGNKIRETHIEQFIGINKEYNIFALQTALAKRDKDKSLEILQFMMNNMNANPLPMLIATLFSYFRKVAIMQSLGSKSDKEIMSELGIPFYFISDYRNAARSFPPKSMEKLIQYLSETDLKFKGIQENTGDEKALLEETVLKILSL
ncbi:MAG: DNA polymerase III subunit delta [Bacteroidia bacterium]